MLKCFTGLIGPYSPTYVIGRRLVGLIYLNQSLRGLHNLWASPEVKRIVNNTLRLRYLMLSCSKVNSFLLIIFKTLKNRKEKMHIYILSLSYHYHLVPFF